MRGGAKIIPAAGASAGPASASGSNCGKHQQRGKDREQAGNEPVGQHDTAVEDFVAGSYDDPCELFEEIGPFPNEAQHDSTLAIEDAIVFVNAAINPIRMSGPLLSAALAPLTSEKKFTAARMNAAKERFARGRCLRKALQMNPPIRAAPAHEQSCDAKH